MEEKSFENVKEQRDLSEKEILSAIESILFVSGEAVYFEELARLFQKDKVDICRILHEAEKKYTQDDCGVTIIVTSETAQMVSNKNYDSYVIEFLQPTQTKNFSQSMLETITIIAYRQPVTRSEIDTIRGIRSEYSVTQLLKQGFIQECGRKDVLGRPMLFGTTDKFLRKFGLHSLDELPAFEKFAEMEFADENSEIGNTEQLST